VPRYARQKDNHSCAPISIFNAMKWMGWQVSYKRDFPEIKKECGCTEEDGTSDSKMRCAIKYYFNYMECFCRFNPKIKEIENHLENDGAIIFDHDIPGLDKDVVHTVFSFKEAGKFIVVNHYWSEKIESIIKRDRLKKLIRPSPIYKPDVWFFSKT